MKQEFRLVLVVVAAPMAFLVLGSADGRGPILRAQGGEDEWLQTVVAAEELSKTEYAPPSPVPLVEFDPPPSGALTDPGLVFEEYARVIAGQAGNFFDDGTWWFKANPRGNVHKLPLQIFDAGREWTYSHLQSSFHYSDPAIQPPLPNDIPSAARVLSGLSLGRYQTGHGWPQFLQLESSGYARLMPAPLSVFGSSNRWSTYRAALDGEQFPSVKSMRVVATSGSEVTLWMVVDGPVLTGAIEAKVTPGSIAVIRLRGRYFLRRDIDPGGADAATGVGGMSSMFWKGDQDTLSDATDHAHDADRFAFTLEGGRTLEVALSNPSVKGQWQRSRYGQLDRITVFGLAQRDRSEAHYSSYQSAQYHLRPTILISDIISSVPFAVGLDVQGTDGEYNDNVVAGMVFTAPVLKRDGPIDVSYVVRAYVNNRLRKDFDGDTQSDVAVFRPTSGHWFVRHSSERYVATSYAMHQWGLPGDIPIQTDFDGDGILELTVYRPSIGGWFIRYSTQGHNVGFSAYFQWGLPGDMPLAADFDGDGKTDLAVFRPSIGGWFIRYSSQNYSAAAYAYYQWGLPGDVPLSTDFDGDGAADLSVWRPATGEWFIRYSKTGYNVADYGYYNWGLPGDVPLAGDFDGDRKTDLAVWRPSIGGWFIRASSSGYAAATSSYHQWGLPGDLPMTEDFDGDGKTDLAVFRPSIGGWFILYSSQSYSVAKSGYYQWGLPGDVPIDR